MEHRGKGKCYLGVGQGRDSNVERPAKRRAGVGQEKLSGLLGIRGQPPASPPLTHSGLCGGGVGCRPRDGFSLQGGPGRGTEVARPSFPGRRRAGANVSFSSLRFGGELVGVKDCGSQIIQLFAGWAQRRGKEGGPAVTALGWRTGGWLVSWGGRTVRAVAGGWSGPPSTESSEPLSPSRDDPHPPAPRPEVSKVNEKFHPWQPCARIWLPHPCVIRPSTPA